jgi:hypothetical protein
VSVSQVTPGQVIIAPGTMPVPMQQDPFAAIARPLAGGSQKPPATPTAPTAAAAPQSPDPFASIAKPIKASAPGTPSTLSDTTPMADPGAGKPYQEPETKGPLHQLVGAIQGGGEAVGGAISGLHDLFQEPQNDDEKSIQEKLSAGASRGSDPSLGSRLALAGYRLYNGLSGLAKQHVDALKAGDQEQKDSGSWKAGLLTKLENSPLTSQFTKLIEDKEYGKAGGGLAANLAMMKGGANGAADLPEAAEAARAAIPEAPVVAGTTLPETVGQAAARANPGGIGADVKGVEDVARKIPGSEGLRATSAAQQDAAREVLANKAREAVPGNQQTFSSAPESIEQNATNAAEAARTAGSAMYEELGKEAAVGSGADLTKPVEAAHSILSDDTLMKLLPKSAREALSKVSSSLSEREEIARQIYGKAFNDLDAAKQGEVGKAMGTGASAAPTTPFADILKARSELSDAANGVKDAADRFQLHKGLDQFDQAINDALQAHDEVNGTDLIGKLGEAKQLWSQKYAFEEFRDGLQDLMRDQPHTGNREMNGTGFQKLVNDLDPRGAKGTTPLQRMFPGDTQSVKDLHDLADFMGRNQGGAGGMASGMAKLRLLGLKESAIGLIASVTGFSWLLSNPGMARNFLTALTAGKDVAKASAAIGAINHAANLQPNDQSTPDNLATPNANEPASNSQPSIERGLTTRNAIDNSGSDAQTKNANNRNSATPAANAKPNPISAPQGDSTPSGVPQGRISVQVPGGKTYHFPSQEAADAFKKNAGIQ